MTRDEAEEVYVRAIMDRGNPEYFVWQEVRGWSHDELIANMNEMDIEVEEIENED